jgi:hypothetical protein
VLRFGEFDSDLAAIPAWLPLAVAAGSIGYAVYLALLGRKSPDNSASAHTSEMLVNWPSATDRRYFDSELQLATSYIDLARSTRVQSDAVECRGRALAIHSELQSWIRTHGGDAGFEHGLERLLWYIEATDDTAPRDF